MNRFVTRKTIGKDIPKSERYYGFRETSAKGARAIAERMDANPNIPFRIVDPGTDSPLSTTHIVRGRYRRVVSHRLLDEDNHFREAHPDENGQYPEGTYVEYYGPLREKIFPFSI